MLLIKAEKLCFRTVKRLIIGIECSLLILYLETDTIEQGKKEQTLITHPCTSTRAGKHALRELDAQLEHV